MPVTVPFIPARGHILLPHGTGTALVDTGSPFSFSSVPLAFGGRQYNLPKEFMGMTPQTISELSGLEIDTLIGCDILSNHSIRIRWREQCLDIDVEENPSEESILSPMRTLSGCPIFPLTIENRSTLAILDTGAHLSYISPDFVSGKAASGQKADFHPLTGHFTVNTWMLQTSLGGRNLTVEYGVLEGELQFLVASAMMLADASAIIGTELLEHYDCTISWPLGTLSWNQQKPGLWKK